MVFVTQLQLTGKTTKPGGKDQVAQPGHVFCAKRAEASEQVSEQVLLSAFLCLSFFYDL